MARVLGQEAEEILPRISEGDPLGVHVVCMRRLREQALVIDPDRAFQRALLEIAVDLSMAGEGDLSPLWLQNSVDRSLARLRRNDQEAERAQAPLLDEGLYAYVHEAFGIPPEDSRRASVAFNAMPDRARQAFFLLLIDGMQVDECLELGLWEPEELRMDVWEAMAALGHVSTEEVEAFRNRKQRKR